MAAVVAAEAAKDAAMAAAMAALFVRGYEGVKMSFLTFLTNFDGD